MLIAQAGRHALSLAARGSRTGLVLRRRRARALPLLRLSPTHGARPEPAQNSLKRCGWRALTIPRRQPRKRQNEIKHQATHRANILFKSVYHSVLKKTL